MSKNFRVISDNIVGFVADDGEIELSKRGVDGINAVSGKGRGNVQELRIVWGCLLSWAVKHNVQKLWCEPTASDGRGSTRERVYSRVGFVRNGLIMELRL